MPIPPIIDPNDDDALADALADAWVEAAATDPLILKAARRAAGLLKAPADMTLDELARSHGTDRFALNRIARRALARLRHSPQISALKPE
jgi:hypothetical protein